MIARPPIPLARSRSVKWCGGRAGSARGHVGAPTCGHRRPHADHHGDHEPAPPRERARNEPLREPGRQRAAGGCGWPVPRRQCCWRRCCGRTGRSRSEPDRAWAARAGPEDRRGEAQRKAAAAPPRTRHGTAAVRTAVQAAGGRLGARGGGARRDPPGRGDGRLRLVPEPRDPPHRPAQPDVRAGQGRRRQHREHLDDRLDDRVRAQGAEPRLRALLAGCQRRQQRCRDDPPSQSGEQLAVYFVHSA